jgi:hypothetical protein
MKKPAGIYMVEDIGLEICTGTITLTDLVRVVISTALLKEVAVEGAMKKPAETSVMAVADMGREVFTGTTLLTGPVLPDMSIVTGEGAAASGVMHRDAADGKLLLSYSEYPFFQPISGL